MDENKFWLNIWRIVGAIPLVLTLSITSCIMHENHLIAELAKTSNPIAARCAYESRMGNDSVICGVIAGRIAK